MSWISYIREVILLIKEYKLVQHFVALKHFYFNPKRFWEKHKQLSLKDKITQFLFYCVLFVCVVIGWNGYTVSNAFKLLSLIVPITLITIILSLGCLLFKYKEISIKDIIIFCCYYLFLLFPIGFIFWETYRITGSYHFLFFYSIIYVLLDLYLWIAPTLIFISKCKHRIFTLISIFIVLNIVEVLIYPMRSNYVSHNTNYIIEERHEIRKSIKNSNVVPLFVVTSKYNSEPLYLLNDTSRIYNIDMNQFLEDLNNDMDLLKTISSKCKYEENKVYFSQLFDLYRSVIKCHETRNYSNNIIKDTIIVDLKGQEVDQYTYRLFNEEILELNNKLLEVDKNDRKKYKYALSPLTIVMWIRPALIIAIKYDNKLHRKVKLK